MTGGYSGAGSCHSGAVFLLLSQDDATLYTQYLCPMQWTSHAWNMPYSNDALTEDGSILSGKDMLLLCGR